MYVRTYGKNDLTEVINLFNDTVKTVNWDEFNDEQKKVALFKSPEPIHDFLNSNITLVLKDDNKIRGFVMMTKKGYIKFLYVDKNHLKKGYGKKLLKRMSIFAELRAMNARYYIFLQGPQGLDEKSY